MKDANESIVDESTGSVAVPEQIYLIPAYGSSAVGLQVTAPANVEVGTGYDFLSGWKADFNAALVRTDGNGITEKELTTTQNLRQTNNYATVSNETSYSKSLSASAQATASYWGINVSASVSALMESKASAASVSTLAQTLVGTKTCVLQRYTDTRLSDAARKRLLTGPNGETLNTPNQYSLGMFIKSYGTHYVEGYSYGGSFNGLVTVNTSSNEDRDEIAAKLKVDGHGQSFEANYAQEVTKVAQSHTVTVSSESIGAFTNPAFNMAGLLESNREFKEKIAKPESEGGGGVRIVAHLVPWGNAAPFTEVVPHELIDQYLLFGSMNADSLRDARGYFNFLSYVGNCVDAYREDYAPGGPWALYLRNGGAAALEACNALDAPRREAEGALRAISLKELSQESLPQHLIDTMQSVKDRWKDLHAVILERRSQRSLKFRIYDKKGIEQVEFFQNPFGTVAATGRNVGVNTQSVSARKEPHYKFPTIWTPVHDSDSGCRFQVGLETKFLSNTDNTELVLFSPSAKGGPLTVAWHRE